MSIFIGNHIYKSRKEKVDHITCVRLRKARLLKGLTLKESAKNMGITPRELSDMEKGRKEIPKEYIFKFMSTYNMTKNFFFYEEVLE